MIFTLNILIELLLIAAGYLTFRKVEEGRLETLRLSRQFWEHRDWATSCEEKRRQLIRNMVKGELDKRDISSKLAEKMADRAFNMASTANLGVVALQKALVIPRLMTKPQIQQNQLVRKDVDNLFTKDGSFDFLRPILSDEENDILDSIEELNMKQASKQT